VSSRCHPELVLVGEHVGYLVLDVLEGGEGDVSSDLLLHIGLLSPGSLSEHLHGDLLRLGVVVLDVLEYVMEWAECRRFLLSAYPRRSPQSQFTR
jgi:hypothetical protein